MPSPTVAVIGCGPAGMSFLHAASTRRRAMESAGDTGDVEGLQRLPSSITVYERSSGPGGVWKAERSFAADEDSDTTDDGSKGRADATTSTYVGLRGQNKKMSASVASLETSPSSESESTNAAGTMYEALWTNGCKERIEFCDYTYADHFGKDCDLPTFMPRQAMLEYIIARVTRHDPTIFDAVRFNTTVLSVTYDDVRSKFTITSRNDRTGQEDMAEYDKCIWAAGEQGRAAVPKEMNEMLKEGGYLGKVIHSSQVGSIDFGSAVSGKNILLVGDSLSAEDLALVAIKAGAEKIYVVSRSGGGTVNYVAAWPQNKVEIIESMMPTEVTPGGYGVRFQEMEYDWEEKGYKLVDNGEIRDVKDLALVIYCTGYESNMSMLENSLKEPCTKWWDFSDLPKDWKMTPNALTEVFGDVTPSQDLECCEATNTVGIYRGLLMTNPNMMFIEQWSDAPLYDIDVSAWLCLAHITGDAEIPSYKEMERRNAQEIMDAMNVPSLRYKMDCNYKKAWCDIDDEHWANDSSDPRMVAMYETNDEDRFFVRRFARDMKDSLYPDDFGTYEMINEKAKAFLIVQRASNKFRDELPTTGPDAEWRTFRDGNVTDILSIHTGTQAAPLRRHWLDLDHDDYSDLLGRKQVEI